MAEKARLQFAPDGYRIAVGEEVSEASDFGVPVEFTAEDGTRYVGFADLGDEEPETHLEYWLYEAEPVECEPEDVDGFGDEEEEDDEDEEDEPLTVNGGTGTGKEAAD